MGVAVMDNETEQRWSYQAGQRFPMCSTFKIIAAAFLAKVDKREDSLSRKVVIDELNLVSYSPLTETRTEGVGMTIAEICDAAIISSDNTAGNTILESIGGPSGLTQFAPAIGVQTSRLDRWETQLNESAIDDPRNTTSPWAMMETLQKLLFGSTLSQVSKNSCKAG